MINKTTIIVKDVLIVLDIVVNRLIYNIRECTLVFPAKIHELYQIQLQYHSLSNQLQ
jgi:hypothetical protein